MVLPKIISTILAAPMPPIPVPGAGGGAAAPVNTGPSPLPISALEPMVGKIINVVIAGAGVVLFFLLVSGGFQLITSGGDPGKVAGAWKTITYAIGGLVVILLSILVLRFIHAFTGVDVTQFQIITTP